MSDMMDAARMIPSLVLFGYDSLSFCFSVASSASSEESSFFPLQTPMRRLMMATIRIIMESVKIKKNPILDIDIALARSSAGGSTGSFERLNGSAVVVVAISLCVCVGVDVLSTAISLYEKD